jgi:hypothetical protein
MYAWIWNKLPFGRWGKVSTSVGLAVAVGLLLWYVVFPWATPLLPFDDVQVSTGTNQEGPAQQNPDAVVPDDTNAPDDLPYSEHSNEPEPSSIPGG